jgi:predicted short-subunit dehydrogenase-like oxidoreductase (DUF2520 family)
MATLPATLTIIGGGHVGKTLGRLWAVNRHFVLQDVFSRSIDHAESAVAFIGAGHAVNDYADLKPADIFMIATPDDHIAQCCEKLAQSGRLSADSIVFHCSGALGSSELEAARKLGAAVASVHPIRSFAAPENLVQNFAGTYCGVEGDQRALDILNPAFSVIGAQPIAIDPALKILYHSAAVFACNYLATLLDVAQQAYVKSGVSDHAALKLMEPLVRETVHNIFRLGPAAALTGPIARGDMATVEKQHKAVAGWNKQHGELYEQFARLTVELAARRNMPKP